MSTIIATTLSNGSVSVPTATVVNGSAKAWVNFNGTGTVAIRDSFNTASITDNGTGRFDMNFSNAMANTNYAAITSGGSSGVSSGMGYMYNPRTTATGLEFVTAGDALLDAVYATSGVQGDLA